MDDLALLRDAAKEAGKIAMRHFRKNPQVWDKGDDQGPVTAADLEIDTMLRTDLLAARPDYGWLSEETDDDTARLNYEHVFIVDPIDGTRAFIDGNTPFAHSLAVAQNGLITAAAVFMPAKDRMYLGARGHGATLNGDRMQASGTKALEGATVLSTKANMRPEHWPKGPPAITRVFRPSLAYRLCLVAEGRYDGMLTLRDTWEWDVAAGALICEEAGATVTDRTDAAPVFNGPRAKLDGMVAGPPDIHQGLMLALTG